jgi:hypothetical protein
MKYLFYFFCLTNRFLRCPLKIPTSQKRRIEIAKLAYISLSTLPDNFFCLHVSGEYDYLMVSGRKVEIVTVLMFNYNQITGKTLDVRFADKFVFPLFSYFAPFAHIYFHLRSAKLYLYYLFIYLFFGCF